jgi:Tol biopolymer transport system component
MPILPGRRLGPYEILSAIGAGGMGEVYRARDTRLDRIVAIKVLPTHLADRSELRERFEREARVVASLNHPHICTLHDIGHQDGIDYLVMEYLEGETLSQRLLKGSLPLEQVLQYAIEISDALDKAHRKGVTHRDLKPGNIMITKTGTKLLDFGLAKLKQEVAPANVQLSELPTVSDPLTAEGSIIGTLQYMAPEQLEAKPADARTDIFAFGVVVYEMASGKKAFEGKSQASLIAAILEREPPAMSSLQPMTPPQLDRVVKICMAKEPDDRWQAASDLCRELKWIAEGGEKTAAPAVKTAGRALWLRLWALAACVALLVVAVIAGLVISSRKPASPAPVSRSVFSLPAGDQLAALNQPAVALSPDGNYLVYVAVHTGVQQLYLHSMNSFEARPIPGTDAASAPFFSPDSQWIGFFAEGALKKVAIAGGAAVTIAEVGGGTSDGATWGANDTIIFQNTLMGSLLSVPAAGGVPQRLSTVNAKKGEITSRWPEFLPSAKAVLFAGTESSSNFGNSKVAVYSLDTGGLQPLTANGTRPRYAPTGHLIFGQGGTLMAALLDTQHLAVTGAPLPIVEGVMQFGSSGVAQYSFSDNGSLAYISGGNQAAQRALVWVDRKGGEQPLGLRSGEFGNPRISLDGRRIAVNDQGQIWIYDLVRESLTRLTFDTSGNLNPVWTIDSKQVIFSAGSPPNLFGQPADGSGKAERLRTSEYRDAPSSWSPDGQALAFSETNSTTGMDIWTLRPSDQKARPFLQTRFNEGAPRFSPDGRWLAYVSDESGRWEIYVQPYPGPGGKWQISTDGGREPVWNRNGRELFYRNGDKMMAVDVMADPSFSESKPRMLFEGSYQPAAQAIPAYDVSPDGQRFLMVKPVRQAQVATQINVVLNWFEELKQKVPTGKK